MFYLKRTPRSPLCLLLLLCSLAGCRAGYVDRGAALYAEHDYVGAAEVFEHNETRLAKASDAERARYALYRGITLQSLGDATRAEQWLQVASALVQRAPGVLDVSEQRTLARAFQVNAEFVARLAQREGPITPAATAAR